MNDSIVERAAQVQLSLRRPPKKLAGQGRGRRAKDGSEVLSVFGCGELIGESPKAVYALAARKKLPHRRLGGRLIFLKREILQFLENLPGVTLAEIREGM